MRESRALAYSAAAFLITPSKLKNPYYYRTFIATQNDKMLDAMKAFDEIINNMPESEKAFNLAKEALITRLRTERTTKADVLWALGRAGFGTLCRHAQSTVRTGAEYDIPPDKSLPREMGEKTANMSMWS